MIGTLVLVAWDDCTSRAWWHSREEVAEFGTDGAWQCLSVGWLLADEPGHIVLAARRTEDGESWGLLERIPRGMVKTISPLEVRRHP